MTISDRINKKFNSHGVTIEESLKNANIGGGGGNDIVLLMFMCDDYPQQSSDVIWNPESTGLIKADDTGFYTYNELKEMADSGKTILVCSQHTTLVSKLGVPTPGTPFTNFAAMVLNEIPQSSGDRFVLCNYSLGPDISSVQVYYINTPE